MSASPLGELLDSLRLVIERRLEEPRERVAQLTSAVEAYQRAIEDEAAHRVALQNGLPHSISITAREAARALRQLVEALPELSDAGSSAPPDESAVIASEGARQAPEQFVYEATEEARELLREVQAADFDAMSIAVFRVYAAELAARARSLQDRKLEAENIPGRVIRKLTAVAHAKGVSSIRGLARWHQDNWTEVARRQRAARERMVEHGATAAASPRTAPVSEYPSIIVHEEDDEEETAVVQQVLPRVQELASRHAIVLIGGVCKNEKLERMKERFGIPLEWVETDRSGMNSITSVENRIRNGRIGAIVIFDGLIRHIHFEALIHAARNASVAVAFGDRAGMAAISRALSEIEVQLGRDDGAATG